MPFLTPTNYLSLSGRSRFCPNPSHPKDKKDNTNLWVTTPGTSMGTTPKGYSKEYHQPAPQEKFLNEEHLVTKTLFQHSHDWSWKKMDVKMVMMMMTTLTAMTMTTTTLTAMTMTTTTMNPVLLIHTEFSNRQDKSQTIPFFFQSNFRLILKSLMGSIWKLSNFEK